MKWSMDTHKYISEITRKALQIMVSHGITSESEAEEIDAVERELGASGVYKDYEGAKGRVRRALFTYFKAYGCLDDSERLTEIGRLYAESKISIREFSFYYILNYLYEENDVKYYPAQLILKFFKLIREIAPAQEYMTAYDFSRIVECNNVDEVSADFVRELIESRNGEPVTVNERSIGYDVWAKMLIQAGILTKNEDKNLIVSNHQMVDWILDAYNTNPQTEKGKICTGVLKNIPVIRLTESEGDATIYAHEGRAAQAFLFDAIDDYTINKYVYSLEDSSFADMRNDLGLSAEESRGFYRAFVGVERLVGYSLAQSNQASIRNIGEIIAAVELSASELHDIDEERIVDHDFDERIENGSNVLLYGVPGSGKSWTIEHEYCKKESRVERLVFHPDYTYSDFIGQILPVVAADGQVSYEFTPGPFTNILKAAYTHPMLEYILVIEEINRGNAPAIFGEVFQLLDRKVEKSDTNDDGYPIGTSEYGITNANIAKIVYGNPNHKVRIPSNLSIIGTMNTSDQNVFTLDTAFQRRWEMRLIENNFENVDVKLAKAEILDTGVTWEVFCTEINDIIVGNNVRMSSSEDKRLGAYFVRLMDLQKDSRMGDLRAYDELRKKESAGILSDSEVHRIAEIREAMKKNRRFPEKVIKYLWDDAFKFNREVIFETTEFRSLESVIRAFMYSEGIERFKMFKQNIVDALQNPDSE